MSEQVLTITHYVIFQTVLGRAPTPPLRYTTDLYWLRSLREKYPQVAITLAVAPCGGTAAVVIVGEVCYFCIECQRDESNFNRLLNAHWLLPRSYRFGEDLVSAAYSLWRTFRRLRISISL